MQKSVTTRDIESRLMLRALAVLLAVDLLLLLMHVVSYVAPRPLSRLHVWFDLDRDVSIASWFASSQLLLAGLLCCFAAWRCWHDRSDRLLLGVAGLGFVFLSADETAMIHERITGFTVHLDWVPRFPGDHGVWIFVYSALGAVLVLSLLRNILRFLHRRTRSALLIGGGLSLAVLGGVGVEILWYYEIVTGPLQIGLEETLELVGGSLIVCGALVLVAPMVALVPLAPRPRSDATPHDLRSRSRSAP